MDILIKNGIVFDPLNKIDGEVMDIAIRDGRIVDESELSGDVYIMDASNKIVMAGAIDIHSHIAGPKVSTGRLLMPQDHYLSNIPHRLPYRRSQTGIAVPNVFKIGYTYAEMGYTFVVEPATPPLKTRHTHEELNDIPIIDKLALLLVDSNWMALDYIVNNDYDRLAAYIAWLLYSTKTYSIKLVDPGSDVAWMYGGESLDLDMEIPKYGLTPKDIILAFDKVCNLLNLPHKIHLHGNRLGYPGNYTTTVNTLKLASKMVSKGISLHMTHVQFTGYSGDSWYNLGSGAEDIARIINQLRNISIDIGQVIPGYTAITMTADAPFEYLLYHITKWKWCFADVESETASGIVPYRYRWKNYVNTIQWVIGLEVLLLTNDLWRVYLTTDHPNAGPFISYPKVISWLMSKKAREDVMARMNRRAISKSILPSINRELTFYDIAIITRAAPAKLLGLDHERGHLGVGAIADIAIYDLNPREIDPSKDYKTIERAFRKSLYTIKNGVIVVKNGEVISTTYGRTYYVNPMVSEDITRDIIGDLKSKFKSYYSISLDNYIIDGCELRDSKQIDVTTKLA